MACKLIKFTDVINFYIPVISTIQHQTWFKNKKQMAPISKKKLKNIQMNTWTSSLCNL